MICRVSFIELVLGLKEKKKVMKLFSPAASLQLPYLDTLALSFVKVTPFKSTFGLFEAGPAPALADCHDERLPPANHVLIFLSRRRRSPQRPSGHRHNSAATRGGGEKSTRCSDKDGLKYNASDLALKEGWRVVDEHSLVSFLSTCRLALRYE